eukprot:jgi/Mesen1/9878/ME000070S09167
MASRQEEAVTADGELETREQGVPQAWYETVRREFAYFGDPTLDEEAAEKLAFMENAGGSQAPQVVIEAMREYMMHSYAQLGAGYPASERATRTVDAAHHAVKAFMNAEGCGEVILGSSSSQLLAMIGECYGRTLRPSDEVIVQVANHEANVGPWVRAAERAACVVKWWGVGGDADPFEQSPLEGLARLLTPRTRIVALTHVSNLLGSITDLPAVVQAGRARALHALGLRVIGGGTHAPSHVSLLPGGAEWQTREPTSLRQLVRETVGPDTRIVVDGVAYAPHRAVDVRAWGVDWYVFSTYKVFGPHMAALYGAHAALAEVAPHGPNHFWILAADVPYKFELGGPAHEGCAGLLALSHYLRVVARAGETCGDGAGTEAGGGAGAGGVGGGVGAGSVEEQLAAFDRSTVERAFARAEAMERPLQARLLECLNGKGEDVTVVGPRSADSRTRVSTVSFVHARKKSSQVSREMQAAGFAVRHGNMYAYRLVEALLPKLRGNSIEEGVVRVSLLHYNTPAEVDRLCRALDLIL